MIFFIALLTLMIPFIASAAWSYDLLAPFSGPTTITSLGDYLNLIFTVTIGITGILAVLMIVICGVKLMGSPSVSAKSEAKGCITNAIFGVIIAIGSWMLLNTINPAFLSTTDTLGAVNTGVTTAAPVLANDPMPTKAGYYFRYHGGDGIVHNSIPFETLEQCRPVREKKSATAIIDLDCFWVEQKQSTGIPKSYSAAEMAARNAFCTTPSDKYCISTTPVSINKPPCYYCGQKNCTNVAGLDTLGIPGVLNSLQSSWGGTRVTLTGGTECGHTSHDFNLPIFDLSRDPSLLNFIKTNTPVDKKNNPSFCKPKTTGTCYAKWYYNGYWYTDEGDHLHVCKDGTTYTGPDSAKAAVIKKACTKII